MHDIRFNLFPNGKTAAITLSYDDGREQDRRLVETLNRYGLRATFHLNSGLFDTEGYVRHDEIAHLYAGHEVAAHTVNHPRLPLQSLDTIAAEITRNRADLEALVGSPVRGFSYPCGGHNHDHRLAALLPALGIAYGRTILNDPHLHLPPDPYRWAPTCHHNDELDGWVTRWLDPAPDYQARALVVWGHSYEFDQNANWELVDELGRRLGGNESIWFTTMIELIDYQNALAQLQFGVRNECVRNPSATDIWLSINGTGVRVRGGETVQW